MVIVSLLLAVLAAFLAGVLGGFTGFGISVVHGCRANRYGRHGA